MMEQRAPKIQSEVVYQRKKKTRHDGIEGTKDQRSSQKSYIKERKRQYMMEQRAPKI